LAQITAGLTGAAPVATPSARAIAEIAGGHYDDMLSFYGTTLGGKVARKHLGWYMDTVGTPAALRREVLTAPPEQVRRTLPLALWTHAEREAA
jgi:tRNA-dihydrouridine synthase